MWEAWSVVIFQGTVPSGRCRIDIKLDYGLDGTTTLQLQCRLAGTADFFNEMPSGRYFNFTTILPSGRHFSHCEIQMQNVLPQLQNAGGIWWVTSGTGVLVYSVLWCSDWLCNKNWQIIQLAFCAFCQWHFVVIWHGAVESKIQVWNKLICCYYTHSS